MPLPPHLEAGDQVILFDGVCRLCSGWVQFIVKHDREMCFKLCSMQSPEGQAILQWFGMPGDSFETMLLVEGATAYDKSEAFLRVIRQLPKPWSLLAGLGIAPRGLRDWCYDRIAVNRYRLFGHSSQCTVVAEQNQKRFLGH